MSVRSIFRQQGGFSLVKNWAQNHVLLYAVCMFLLLPKNKKGLEMLRECVDFKIYLHLRRKYKKEVEAFLSEYSESDSRSRAVLEKPKIIWFCWLQGIENAPPLVKKCYESIRMHCADYDIRIVTAENFSEQADIPDFIIKKWKDGIISYAHFSDILRTALLVKNGGTWIDSTVLITASVPSDIEASPLFLFRTYKPGSNAHCTQVSSWFISSAPHNPILEKVQSLLDSYWKKQNRLCHYFLFHFFVEMVFGSFPKEASLIPEYTNETPHFLLFELSNQFSQEKWDSITAQSFCHKLTNKLGRDVKAREGTFYKHIAGEEI